MILEGPMGYIQELLCFKQSCCGRKRKGGSHGRARVSTLILFTNALNIFSLKIRLVAERSKDGVISVKQVQDGVEFGHLSSVHDQDAVVIR